MKYRYSLTNDLRAALERCELLGKDTIEQAAEYVLKAPDWRSYPPLADADIDDLSIIAAWEADTLEANGVKSFRLNDIYGHFRK